MAKLEPQSITEFLQVVLRSEVVTQTTLDASVGRLITTNRMPETASQLADCLVEQETLTAFQASMFLRGLWRRFVLGGKYRILRPLGHGGMGTVYLAAHRIMQREVAIKVLPASSDGSLVERFQREARAVAALTHPNIVQAFDVDHDGPFHFLVMEHIDGRSLLEIVQHSGPLDIPRAVSVIAQVASALQHAHEAGLVHRDVKPGNMLMDRDGTVKLLDLGLARFFRDKSDELTKVHHRGQVLGTADYLAPEQFNDSHLADIRSDIYSLGMTAYYLLAGKLPYQGMAVPQRIMSAELRGAPSVSDYRSEVPAELAAIIRKMMAREPSVRYAIPGEIIAALKPWTPIAPEPPGKLLDVPEIVNLPAYDSLHVATQTDSMMAAPATQVGAMFSEPAEAIASRITVKQSTRHWTRLLLGMLLVAMFGGAMFAFGRGWFTPAPRDENKPSPVAPVTAMPKLQLLVPAYFYPAGDGLSEWDRLFTAAAEVPIVAIVNPSSGPGMKPNLDYQTLMNRDIPQNLRLIGYVSTVYGKRPLTEVEADMNRWVQFYPHIHGFFFDEQASAGEQIGYYEQLFNHARRLRPDGLIISNPGTQCAESYVARPTADAVCMFERGSGFEQFHLPTWTTRYGADRYAVLLPDVAETAQMRRYLRLATERHMGYVYITDFGGANPWASLPNYWDDELRTIRSLNAGR